ncbi:hypothetical protein [Pseudonocardia spinosispora]|uniref:hypothetical protein n=1 Tax=Pseudonocardia spinosispora TaxID=103441 RepID=UPI000419818A|nr:hypothetical protein [Pseudonocardia spinosispora]
MRPFPDATFPADPYPGAVPDCSFVHLDGVGYPLRHRESGWRTGPDGLDEWLAARDAVPVAGRLPVLAYGSNRCPSKITWLRESLGLSGPVVVLTVVVEDVAAVWASGFRVRDGQRPATLAAMPGTRERHSLWLATPDQLAVLDRCEGRGIRYRLARLRSGTVRTEDGAVVDRPHTYLGQTSIRLPLLVDGVPVRCTDVDQLTARELRGEPADSDGLLTDEPDR